MVGYERISAVVTAPFGLKNPDPIVAALQELLSLKVGRVLVSYDGRGPSRLPSHDAVAQLSREYEEAGISVRCLQADGAETALRWHIGVVESLQQSFGDGNHGVVEL